MPGPLRSFLIAGLMVISGCASLSPSKLRPLPSAKLLEPFAAQVGKKSKDAQRAPDAFASINEALDDIAGEILAPMGVSAAQGWELGEVTLVGGVAATLGALASKTGLTNTGLGLGGIGLATDTFYKPETQLDIHLKHYENIACMKSELSGITDQIYETAIHSAELGKLPQEDRDLIYSSPKDSIRHVQAALNLYLKELLTLRSPVIDRTQLAEIFKKESELSEQRSGILARRENSSEDEKRLQRNEELVSIAKLTGLANSLKACYLAGR